MKKSFTIALALAATVSFAQNVGINTDVPAATLDVVGKPADSAVLDGIIAPRITGNQLSEKTYTAAQTGAVVYATASADTLSGQVVNVNSEGFYFFNGTVWQKINSTGWQVVGNSGTSSATNFLGTTDDVALVFRTNNTRSGFISNSTGRLLGLGYNALSGPALVAETAVDNIAIGNNAMSSVNTTTATQNVAIGHNALKNATDPRYNTAIGHGSQQNITNGRNNVSLGIATLANATTAGLNTAIGGSSMAAVTSGTANNALGLSSLQGLTEGHANSVIGQLSGSLITTGSYNTVIGNYNNQVFDPTGNRQLNIGNLIYGTGLSTGVFQTRPGTTSYNEKRIGIAVAAQPNSTLEVNGSVSARIRSLASGIIANDDYTVLVGGNISLPVADATNTGRIYNLVHNVTNPVTITGTFRINGSNISSYDLNGTVNGSGLTVQSNGSAWVVISRY